MSEVKPEDALENIKQGDKIWYYDELSTVPDEGEVIAVTKRSAESPPWYSGAIRIRFNDGKEIEFSPHQLNETLFLSELDIMRHVQIPDKD